MTKMDKKYRIRIEKCFSYQTVLLIALGIVINVIFPRLMIACSAPLYLDNIGSILVAALGGAVPGMHLYQTIWGILGNRLQLCSVC